MGFEGRAFAVVGVLAAVFAVQVLSNDIKTLYTNGYYYSQFFPLDENIAAEKTLRFSVRASKDAHVLLAPGHQADGPVYEIVLGAHDNTVNFIRGRCPCQEEPSATIRTVNLLSQKEFRNFWVRTKSDSGKTFIQVGMGGKKTPFHEWRDPRPLTLLFLSFRSGTAAEWRYGFSDDTYTTGVSKDKRQSVVTSTGYGQYFALSEIVSHSDDAVMLYFTLRTAREFQILLSPSVSSLGDVYEFGLNETLAYVRRRHLGGEKAVFKGENLVDGQQRIRYWIKLSRDGKLSMGRQGAASPYFEWQDQNPLSPQFASFTLHRERGEDPDAGISSDIQFGLGSDYTLASQDCRPRWKDGSVFVPPGAVRGGRDDVNELFICRATHESETLPGSLALGRKQPKECVLSAKYAVHRKKEFQVLTGCRFTWASGSLGQIPDGAIPGGETSQNERLYVSRVTINNQVIVGKLVPNNRLTYIPSMGQELPFTSYEVLVKRNNQQTSVNSRRGNSAAVPG